ncbi:MAG TPA: hypothetical protein VHB98_02760 [Chloroflexota bacterium]|nr:hypothetical protein [Chloroflexota bacterium]
MDVCFELSDRYYEQLGPWPLAVGEVARAQLYAFRDHSPEQHGGRLLLPDLALASPGAPFTLRRLAPPLMAFCGLIGALRTRRIEGRERRDETTLRIECGVPVMLILQTRRWDNVDVAPVQAAAGAQAWQLARPPRVADLLCGTFELREAAFAVAGTSSFPFLSEQAPEHPVQGRVMQLERLNLDPSAEAFGSLESLERLPDGIFWPHRYFVTLAV